MENRHRWRGVVVALVIMLALAGPVSAFGGAVTPSTVGVVEAQESPTATPTPTPTPDSPNGSVVRHENPESADGQGDLDDVQSWLAGRMSEVVVDCAQQVQVGSSYVCDRLDEDYPKWASQYVDVAGDTPGSDDDNTTRVLNETRRTQQRFAEQTQEFRETQEAYEEARESGNDERARELARDLSRQAATLNETSANLTRNLRVIDENSPANVSEATVATDSVTTSVTESAAEIRTRELVATSLTASASASTVSFGDPVRVVGRLTTDDGETLANRTVVLRTPEGTQSVQTDSEGTYTLVYRPRTARVGGTNLSVQYAPRDTALYQESTASVGVDVVAVTPTVTVDRTPDRVGFGQRVTVTGRVAVDDTGASSVPVVVRLGGRRVGSVRTTADGQYTLATAIPAEVPSGSVTVESRVALEGRALNSTATTTNVRVLTTSTSLDASASRTAIDEARVSGTLRANGTRVAGEPVVVVYDGRTVARGETDEAGQFDVNASFPTSVSANESATLTVRYDPPPGRNLAGSEATVEAAESGAGTDGATGGLDPLVVAVVALLVTGVGVVLYVLRDRLGSVYSSIPAILNSGESRTRSRVDDTASTDEGPESTSLDGDAVEAGSTAPGTATTIGTVLGEAGEILEERPEDAVVRAYTAIHGYFVDVSDLDPQSTHWELLTAARGELDGGRGAALERLVTAYERAAFSPEATTVERARDAIEAAGSVFDGAPDPSTSSDD